MQYQHREQHPLSGRVLSPDVRPLIGPYFTVIDWADRVTDQIPIGTEVVGAVRWVAHDLPTDGEYVFGMLTTAANPTLRPFLLHQSEVEKCSALEEVSA